MVAAACTEVMTDSLKFETINGVAEYYIETANLTESFDFVKKFDVLNLDSFETNDVG